MALVKDFMTRDVLCVERDKEVHELERMMLEEKVHGSPVVDEEGRLVGVVSQTDLLAWHFASGVDGAAFYNDSPLSVSHEELKELQLADVRTARVEEVMSPLAYCIGADRPITEAAAMMIEKWIHRLVVVDEELRVQGIVSAIDLLHAIPGTTESLKQSRDSREDEPRENDGKSEEAKVS
ncbi:MAG: CBS domain-containing protein [bacterium]|nr:CBS domain-containing protein [bacterium]